MKVKGELNQITDFERDQADVATVPVFGWVAAIGMEVVLLLGNAEEKKIRYENLLNELSPKISDIQIEINECRQKIVQIYYDIGKCERKKSQAQAEQLLIKKSRDTINIWLKTMNIWLEYLTTLEPQAERVETHIGLSQTALNSAIEEFKIFVNSASENAIQAATNILAIAYTPTSGILENITLPLNDS
uniref:Uncharacterized protein n=1 Tax=Panagrolaimus davidi TaxID=227884 RepID=A0A914QJK6_9BILA